MSLHWPELVTGSLLLVATAAAQTQGDAGVLVRVYDIGSDLRQVSSPAPGELPNLVAVKPVIDLSGERGDFGDFTQQFVTEVVGFISVSQPGSYIFRLVSDDGAQLWIDRKLVVDHDGLHGPEPRDGVIELPAGKHEFRILHFQAFGGAELSLQWRLPGATGEQFELVPDSVLSHPADVPRQSTPGRKPIIPPLRRGRPGDGTPVAGPHPGFRDQVGQALSRGQGRYLNGGWVRLPSHEPRPGPAILWADADPDRSGSEWPLLALAGRYEGQLLIPGSVETRRAQIETADRRPQGCVFRFSKEPPIVPVPGEKIVFEMLAVRAMSNGLEIEFTKPLDLRVGWEADSYYVEQWPFDAEKGAGPTRDGSSLPVKSASVSEDRRHVFLEVPGLRPPTVVYLRLLPPCLSEEGELPWSTEAWYTLHQIPADRPGKVLPRPPQPPQNVLTEPERQAGWRLLFDGRTTRGWRGYKQDRFPDQGWKVIDGCLVRVGPGGDITTEEEFDNFELKLEWRISPGGNSGIFFRVSEEYKWPWETGPEMQVLDNAEHADGRNPMTSAGSYYGMYAPACDATRPVGLFNQVRIVADGPHLEYWLNDVKVVECELGSPEWERRLAASKFKDMPASGRIKRGHIVLQDHGDKVWYRNLKIRPLSPASSGDERTD